MSLTKNELSQPHPPQQFPLQQGIHSHGHTPASATSALLIGTKMTRSVEIVTKSQSSGFILFAPPPSCHPAVGETSEKRRRCKSKSFFRLVWDEPWGEWVRVTPQLCGQGTAEPPAPPGRPGLTAGRGAAAPRSPSLPQRGRPEPAGPARPQPLLRDLADIAFPWAGSEEPWPTAGAGRHGLHGQGRPSSRLLALPHVRQTLTYENQKWQRLHKITSRGRTLMIFKLSNAVSK